MGASSLIKINKFLLNDISLTMEGSATKEDWEKGGRDLGKVEKASAFWIGDWCKAGVDAGFTRGDTYDEAAKIVSLGSDTVEVYTSLARKIDPDIRRSDLSIRHHQAVAALPPKQQEKILNEAAAHQWTSDETREKVSGHKPKQSISKSRDEECEDIAKKLVTKAEGLKKWVGVVKAIEEIIPASSHGKRTEF